MHRPLGRDVLKREGVVAARSILRLLEIRVEWGEADAGTSEWRGRGEALGLRLADFTGAGQDGIYDRARSWFEDCEQCDDYRTT